MKVVGFLAWAIAVVAGFYISGIVSRALLAPFASADADVAYSVLVGTVRFVIWVAIVFCAALAFRAVTKKPRQ